MAFVLNQMGIIIVRDMSSTDRRRQCRMMPIITAVMTKSFTVITTVTVTESPSDENKEKQGP